MGKVGIGNIGIGDLWLDDSSDKSQFKFNKYQIDSSGCYLWVILVGRSNICYQVDCNTDSMNMLVFGLLCFSMTLSKRCRSDQQDRIGKHSIAVGYLGLYYFDSSYLI